MHASFLQRHRTVLLTTLALGALALTIGIVFEFRSQATLPPITISLNPPTTLVATGAPPKLHWPTQGQAAVAIPSLAVNALASTPDQRPVPIASLAKLMTAYLVLERHPLAVGSQGPTLTMTSTDEQQYYDDVAQDQSSVEVTAGEQLTEYQLLQALLTRSANNVAQLLASWVAGSQDSFVAQMNQTATRLGLTNTHFADASGFNPATKATAQAVASIAAMDMRNAVFDQIVDEHTVTLPLIGTLPNIVARIGTANVIGIKSGYTIWSGGCAAIATEERSPSGSFPAVAVVLDQQGPASLHHAASIAEQLADEVGSGVVRIDVVRAHQRIGSLRIPWLGRMRSSVELMLTRPLKVALWPGQTITYQVRLTSAPHLIGRPAGAVAGYLVLSWPMHTERIAIVTTGAIPPPSRWWRVLHA
ncbi:MAG: D-alanyl-D-alanine carboxypeptidase family protein [Ferrimicrobium sp.]